MKDIVLIAKFRSAHGIKGNIKLELYTENLEYYSSNNLLFDEKGNRYNIKKISAVNSGLWIVRVNSYCSRSDIVDLVGINLYVKRSDFLDNLEDSEFYIVDLIGCNVLSVSGNLLGVVTDLVNYGAGDILCINSAHHNKQIMYPFGKDFYSKVDIESKSIVISGEL